MTPVRLGQELDHYRSECVAARSGMVSIFRGTGRTTGTAVAIKVPHPEMECDPEFFARFPREEEIGQEMDHPGVMKVMRNPQRSRGYMVMEWLDGRLLRQILTPPARLARDRAVRLAVCVYEALEYIHSRGVAHRDLKRRILFYALLARIPVAVFGLLLYVAKHA